MEWRWGFAVAAAIMVLAMLPQVWLAVDRGNNWHGANASLHPDEVAYSAYVASLIRGRPRRNDPYAGRSSRVDWPVAESLFSIQILPAIAVAEPARLLGVSASATFIAIPIISAWASALAIFWLMSLLTRDSRFAATAVVVMLGAGTLFAAQGMLRHFLNLPYLIPWWLSQMVSPTAIYHLPFLRSYQPAIAFPLFFLICGLIWIALVHVDDRKALIAAAGGGVAFVVLVFSYFFLWTAVAAWLFCLFLIWLFARKDHRRRLYMVFGTVAAFATPAVATYFVLLSRRATTVDTVQALVQTHRPDLLRLPELVAYASLALLWLGVRQRVFACDEVVLFVSSLALAILLVFNQQVVTGHSLQPVHYEWFIANYCAAAVLVLTAKLWWRRSKRNVLSDRHLAVIGIIALLWGAGEVWLGASLNLQHNRAVDQAKLVSTRLNELAASDGTIPEGQFGAQIPVVLMSDLPLADRLPTDAPQSVLWAPRMLVFPGVMESENRERFFQQLYYQGYNEEKFNQQLDRGDWNFYAGLFSYDRLSPVVTGSTRPIAAAEIRAQLRNYLSYANSFTSAQAKSPTLSYIVVHANEEPDYSNLDRWYERTSREQLGEFVLYRLRLRVLDAKP